MKNNLLSEAAAHNLDVSLRNKRIARMNARHCKINIVVTVVLTGLCLLNAYVIIAASVAECVF